MRLCHWGTETDVPPPNTYAKRMSAAKPYLLICLFGMPAQVHLEEKAVSLVVINMFLSAHS